MIFLSHIFTETWNLFLGPNVPLEDLEEERMVEVVSNSDESDRDSENSNIGMNSDEENEGSEEYEESEEEHWGEPEEVNNDNTPIFNGASITFREGALAILTFILTHKLTGLCLTDLLLLLLSLHCGANNILLKSLYKFKKYFQMIGKNFIKLHYYCSNCEKLLPGKTAACCANQQLDTYFIEFPIINQLEVMFARPGFFEELQYRFNRVKKVANNVEDIYDGTIYDQLFNDGFLNNPNNISFFCTLMELQFLSPQIFQSGRLTLP
jgi:hypothetical protein